MRFAILLLVLAASPALARRPLSVPPSTSTGAAGANWSATRATAKPDAVVGQDHVNAWASMAPDQGVEWLELEYDRAVEISEVVIHQSFNPGAVVRVAAMPRIGGPVDIWTGKDVPQRPVLRVKAHPLVKARTLRVYLNTSKVAGWNEIDAVAIVGSDMVLQWASKARASSSYGAAIAGPWAALIGQKVRVEHIKGSMTGKLVAVRPQFMEVLDELTGKPVFIGVSSVVTIRAY
jgi:hypothetical protein